MDSKKNQSAAALKGHKKPGFTLTLEAKPSPVPVIVRRRRARKILGRAYALRCVAIQPEPADEAKSEIQG